MSVIVKGMEMPVMCSYCKFIEPFIDYAYCHSAEMDMKYEEIDNCRHPNCPLIELPFAEELAEKLYKQIEKAVIEGSEI